MDCKPLKVNYIFQMFDFTIQNLDLEKSWMAPSITLHCSVCKQPLTGNVLYRKELSEKALICLVTNLQPGIHVLLISIIESCAPFKTFDHTTLCMAFFFLID